jgi:hypothetical protein
MLVDALLPQPRALSASIARFDEEIARLAPQLPDYELFAALRFAPGRELGGLVLRRNDLPQGKISAGLTS